jgi:segregation and condensation protein B
MAKRGVRREASQEPAIKPGRTPQMRVVRIDDEPPEPAPPIDDSGISLEELGQAYAALLNRGDVPYEEPAQADVEAESHPVDPVEELLDEPLPKADHDASCELSPKSILEAMLFVGHPHNEPLTARLVASFMRGVLPEEIDDLVRELNQQYELEQAPYAIFSEGPGYRLALREEFASIREQFYGKVREAKLSQAAVDTLAVIAYHQPVGQKAVDELRGKPSGAILSQLVRRQLIRIERSPEKPREALYRTTSRFLDLFGLESLDDLPRTQDLEG